MAFLDLEEAIREEFAQDDDRPEQQALWQSRRYAQKLQSTYALRAERTLTERLIRQSNSVRADRLIPAPLPRAVACRVCRREYMNQRGLDTHFGTQHRGI